MDRRNFIKMLGFTPLLGLLKPKKEPIWLYEEDLRKRATLFTNNVDPLQAWSSGSAGSTDMGDQIVAIDKYKGRLLVYCEHSIWELEGSPPVNKKLLTRI